jgi:hypothetical protein
MPRVVAGFTLLLLGIILLVTPGPDWLVFFAMCPLAAEFI